jgi:hypothetical protein
MHRVQHHVSRWRVGRPPSFSPLHGGYQNEVAEEQESQTQTQEDKETQTQEDKEKQEAEAEAEEKQEAEAEERTNQHKLTTIRNRSRTEEATFAIAPKAPT